jgi:hypothetical protein
MAQERVFLNFVRFEAFVGNKVTKIALISSSPVTGGLKPTFRRRAALPRPGPILKLSSERCVF